MADKQRTNKQAAVEFWPRARKQDGKALDTGTVPGNKTEKHGTQGQCQETKRKGNGHKTNFKTQKRRQWTQGQHLDSKRKGNGHRASIWIQNGKVMDTGPTSGFKTER